MSVDLTDRGIADRRGPAEAGGLSPSSSSSRRPLANSASPTSRPASTSSRNEQIEQSPAVVADDVLRQVPTFSLFRRTSSLAANPTAQGVSLRGIGPSGVSRTLVLLDDIPFNDPFGGWVYWTRVPMMDAERIEIVDGATLESLRQLRDGRRHQHRHQPCRRRAPSSSSRSTATAARRRWICLPAMCGASSASRSTRRRSIPTATRSWRRKSAGSIDNEANVKYQNVSAKLDYNPTDRVNLFFRGGVFDEERNNGKIGEVNDTNWKYGSGGVAPAACRRQQRRGPRVLRPPELLHSTFFAVPAATVPPRSQRNLTLDQNVPTNAVGTMVQWSRRSSSAARSHVVSAGTDFRWIDGDSDEQTLRAGDRVDAAHPPRLRRHAENRRRVRAGL